MRPGVGLGSYHAEGSAQEGFHYGAGDEFIVSYADAATLLRDRGTRHFEIVDDFETDSDRPPEGTISIERP